MRKKEKKSEEYTSNMLSSGSENCVFFGLIKTLYPNRINHHQVQETRLRQNNRNLMYPYHFPPILIRIMKNIRIK